MHHYKRLVFQLRMILQLWANSVLNIALGKQDYGIYIRLAKVLRNILIIITY
jgi:hypothetical protein